MTSAILVLEDGRYFRGESYGALGETFGEAVFSTAMTGYQETLTDPSYHRQVVVMTAPHVGNTGWNGDDDESRRIWVAGYVVRDPARISSNWRATHSLDAELVRQGVVGISGIDTRALTRHLRERESMRVGISSIDHDPDSVLDKVLRTPLMAGANLVADVTTDRRYVVQAKHLRRFTVAAIDLGIKGNTPARMSERGIETHVFPATADIDQIMAIEPDAVFLSNGPGDPATAEVQVSLAREVLDRRVPLFGICFGHQIMARALGFETYKLKYGHRGINQPVLDRATGKVEVTAHNHGFAVAWPGHEHGHSAVAWPEGNDSATREGAVDSPFGRVEVSHVCLNDGVVEGLRCLDTPAFSVQYHPEAAAGPHDADYLFDRLVELIEGDRDA